MSSSAIARLASQRLYVRPEGGGGLEETLTRECSAVTEHLRAAAALRPAETVELQRWSACHYFPGRASVEERTGALQTTTEWRRRDTVWADGSRLDSGDEGAACIWRTPAEWTGHRFHLGTNKEAFDAEVCAIYRALCILGRRWTAPED